MQLRNKQTPAARSTRRRKLGQLTVGSPEIDSGSTQGNLRRGKPSGAMATSHPIYASLVNPEVRQLYKRAHKAAPKIIGASPVTQPVVTGQGHHVFAYVAWHECSEECRYEGAEHTDVVEQSIAVSLDGLNLNIDVDVENDVGARLTFGEDGSCQVQSKGWSGTLDHVLLELFQNLGYSFSEASRAVVEASSLGSDESSALERTAQEFMLP